MPLVIHLSADIEVAELAIFLQACRIVVDIEVIVLFVLQTGALVAHFSTTILQ